MNGVTRIAMLIALHLGALAVAQEHPPEKSGVEALIKEAMELMHQEGLDAVVMERAQDLLHQGMAQFHEGRLEEAREQLDRCLDQLRAARRPPEHLRKQYEQLAEWMRRLTADAMSKQWAQSWIEQARTHQEQGHLEQASRILRQAVVSLKDRARELEARRTPEEGDRLLHAIQELDPMLAEHLQRLREREPDLYQAELQRVHREIEELERLRRENPEEFELAQEDRHLCREADRLAEHFRHRREKGARPEGFGPDELRAQLHDVVTRLFDLRLRRMEREIARKERELAELQHMLHRQLEVLTARQERREELIRRRVGEYLDESDLENW